MIRTTAALTALLALSATAAHASVKWADDGASLSKWSIVERVAPDRIQVVDEGGQPAIKFTVHQGDDPINASGNRAEVVYTGDPATEEERFYAWSTLFPADFTAAKTWQLFTQWHHDGTTGSPPVEFFVNGDTIHLNVNSTEVWSTPLVKGQWHDFVMHVRWSSDPSKGFVEVLYDGQVAMPKKMVKTLFPGQGVYLKHGLYRNESIAYNQSIFQRKMRIGTTLADVQTAAPAPAPPPAVATTTPPATTTTPAPGTPAAATDSTPATATTEGSGSLVLSGADGTDTNQQALDGSGTDVVVFPNGETMKVDGQGCASTGGLTLVPALLAIMVVAFLRRRRQPARVPVFVKPARRP